jgi:putative NIF3 family GTP cyclohydrolase 1 type 2
MFKKELGLYLAELFQIKEHKVSSFNGLQLGGKMEIKSIVTTLEINIRVLYFAIKKKADAILVYYGLSLSKDIISLLSTRYRYVHLLIKNNINLFIYHLPLDIHSLVGDNILLAKH